MGKYAGLISRDFIIAQHNGPNSSRLVVGAEEREIIGQRAKLARDESIPHGEGPSVGPHSAESHR